LIFGHIGLGIGSVKGEFGFPGCPAGEVVFGEDREGGSLSCRLGDVFAGSGEVRLRVEGLEGLLEGF